MYAQRQTEIYPRFTLDLELISFKTLHTQYIKIISRVNKEINIISK